MKTCGKSAEKPKLTSDQIKYFKNPLDELNGRLEKKIFR